MILKTSKIQNPRSREAPNAKPPRAASEVRAVEGWSQHRDTDGTLILRDGSTDSPNKRHPFDLEERTARFGEAVILFSKKIPRNPTNNRLIDQLVGSGTSVGANYCEANEGVSQKDFRNSVSRCKKEAKETGFFLRMVAVSEPSLAEEARALYREVRELRLIFASMYRK